MCACVVRCGLCCVVCVQWHDVVVWDMGKGCGFTCDDMILYNMECRTIDTQHDETSPYLLVCSVLNGVLKRSAPDGLPGWRGRVLSTIHCL